MSVFAQLIERRAAAAGRHRAGGTQQKRVPVRPLQRTVMSQEARNDAKAQRMVAWLYAEGVSPENITRLLNYHFEDTYGFDKETQTQKSVIRRVPDGSNFAPSVEIWRQA